MVEVDLSLVDCCSCAVSFWITRRHNDALQNSKKQFFCPNGHGQSYQGESCEAKATRFRRLYEGELKTVGKLHRQIKSLEKGKPKKKK